MASSPPKYQRNAALDRLRAQIQLESSDGLRLLKSLRNNPLCALSVDKSVPCVMVVWKRYVTSAQLRFVHEHILRLLIKHKMRAVLGDDTVLPTIHADDQRWIVEDWMPRAQAAGLKACASKRPLSYFGKLAIHRVHSVAPDGVELRSFERIEDARGWLQSTAGGELGC
jgi:hypothetical protein